MSKFNLSFQGEILPGYKPERVKTRFAKLFAIDDADKVELFFSGQPVILRRNLDRKEAADLFRKLHDIGLTSELVKVDAEEAEGQSAARPTPAIVEPEVVPSAGSSSRGMDQDILQRTDGRVDQSWAVPSRKPATDRQSAKKEPKPGTAAQAAESSGQKLENAEAITRRRAEEAAADAVAANAAAAAESERAAREEEAQRQAQEQAAREAAVKAERQAKAEALKKAQAEAAAADAAAAEARRIAEEEAARKKAEEDAAKAAAAEAKRLANEKAAKEKAEAAAEVKRLAREKAAKEKAEAAVEAKRIAQQEAARKKAEAEAAKAATAEAKRLAREKAAKVKAEAAAEAKRIAQEEAAKKKAEAEAAKVAAAEAKRLVREKAAKEKAEAKAQREAEAETKRIAREEAARKKAEERAAAEEAKRLAAEEAARKRAEEEARKQAEQEQRLAAAAAAKRKAEEAAAEAQRLAQERAARERAEQERIRQEELEAQRVAEADAARKEAEEAQARQLAEEQAEQERIRQAELEARRVAELEAAKKQAADAEAQRLAQEQAAQERLEQERQELERRAAEDETTRRQAAVNEAARRRSAAEEAERLALEEEAKYLAAAVAARNRAKEEHLKAEAAARMAALEESGTPDLFGLEQQDSQSESPQSPHDTAPTGQSIAADALPPSPHTEAEPSSAEATDAAVARGIQPRRLRTKIELPGRVKINTRTDTGDTAPNVLRKVQPGAPNLFNIRPFRNTAAIRERAERSHMYSLAGLAMGGLTVIAMIALAIRFSTAPAAIIVSGPDSIATGSNGELILLVGDTAFMHDRSGTATESLQLPRLPDASAMTPLYPVDAETYLLTSSTPNEELADGSVFERCMFSDGDCTTALRDNPQEEVSGFVVNDTDGAIIVANHRDALLRKYSAEGELLAETSTVVPNVPVQRLHDGLLYMNSGQGPALSVYRPDDANFGRQLDEVLLLPPEAAAAGLSSVRDFAPFADRWWVLLSATDPSIAALYLFDQHWGFIRQVELPSEFNPEQLNLWGEKILVSDSQSMATLRYNGAGEAEAPFESTSLAELRQEQLSQASTGDLLWRITLGILAILALCAFVFAYIHRVRSLIYKSGSTRGAEPLEDYADTITWLEPAQNRRSRFVQLGVLYVVGALGAVIVLVGLGVSASQLLAGIIALSGPMLALLILYRSPIGHIGHSGATLSLVDHNKLYHMGSESQVHYRNRFLIVGDVVVFIGSSLLPTFERRQLRRLIPLAEAGIKVERKAVWVKLLQARHPLATGAIVGFACLMAAGLILVL